MGKNNLLLALKELAAEGLVFDVQYSRGPFFLKGSRKEELDSWYAGMGLPSDAPRWKVAEIRKMNDKPMDALFEQSGLSPRNTEATDTKVWTQTMTAHRLAQYAATESPEKGERIWIALSRRFFMGKDTEIRPIRLDDTRLLMECAAAADLDLERAREVLEGGIISEQSIYGEVEKVHAVGIHSIPVLVFEVEGLAQGHWLSAPPCAYREIHHGSGNNGSASFKALLQELHHACTA